MCSLFIVHSGKGYSFKTHFCKQFWGRGRVPECIQVPSMLWCDPERLLKEGMASHNVHNKFLISWTGLVTRSPSSINEFKLSILNKIVNIIFSGLILQVPPPFKVIDLGPWELPMGEFTQFFHYWIKYVSHLSIVIVFWSFEPAHVIMSVWDKVYMIQSTLWGIWEHIFYYLLLFCLISGQNGSCYIWSNICWLGFYFRRLWYICCSGFGNTVWRTHRFIIDLINL